MVQRVEKRYILPLVILFTSTHYPLTFFAIKIYSHHTKCYYFLLLSPKAPQNRKLTFMYLANDVIQNSRKKGPEFTKEFASALKAAFTNVSK